MVAASALESLVEHGLRWVVKIGARQCMAGDRKGGSVIREGRAEIWVDRCLWVLGVWPAHNLGSGSACLELGWAGRSLVEVRRDLGFVGVLVLKLSLFVFARLCVCESLLSLRVSGNDLK